jgi:isopentenyl-diphosphate Delta-isomerase
MAEKIVLVDEHDKKIGVDDKMSAHKKGKLHRAFSIFIFNSKGKLLIQKRAEDKYHCGGLWSNTVCSHPRPDESIINAAHRRLKEEMGFDRPLKGLFKFHYRKEFDNGLIENEIDHVFVGTFNGEPNINQKEVGGWRWVSTDDLMKDMQNNPEKYTYWLKKSFKKVLQYWAGRGRQKESKRNTRNPFSSKKFKSCFNEKVAQYIDGIIDEQGDPRLGIVWTNLKNYILAGGKRLRPNILNRMNEEFKKLGNINNILLAFEFLHNSTLIDDDIIDEHNIRRDKPTLPYIYGSKNYKGYSVALLSANLLRTEGANLILNSSLPREFQKECMLAYQDIGNGVDMAQVLDLECRGRLDISEEDYVFQVDLVAARFIAYMFQLCAPEQYKSEFFEIGRNLGIAFQLVDDLMDVDKEKQKGRPIGSDIREGTSTLLSIYTYKRLDGINKKRFRELFGKKNLSKQELQWIVSQYENSASIAYLKEKIRYYLNKTSKILLDVGIPEDHWIVTFGEYSLKRSH